LSVTLDCCWLRITFFNGLNPDETVEKVFAQGSKIIILAIAHHIHSGRLWHNLNLTITMNSLWFR
jgi:hypothetical protein